MKEFLEKFESLLKADKFEEAKQLLSTFGSLNVSPEEATEGKLFITELYMRLMNAANKAYLSTLDEAIQKLKILDVKEREVDEKLNLAKARAGLAQ